MSEIQVVNLGKAYKTYPSQWARLAEWLIPNSKPRHELKWVLTDISFHIKPGEALGVVGMNGAGKSTLLKILTGTTQATSGHLSATGRVAALLELGIDRKSTRLNSSHVRISYAVFCLKKKNSDYPV